MTSNLDKIDQFSDLRDRARQMARSDGPRAFLVVCAAIASVADSARAFTLLDKKLMMIGCNCGAN